MIASYRRTLTIAALASAVTSALWIGLAWRTPTSTFHFAPFIAAAVGPFAAKTAVGRQGLRCAVIASVCSAAVVGAAIMLLMIGDRMQGPTFWASDGAAGEAALFAVAGAAAGFAMLMRFKASEATTDCAVAASAPD